MKTLLSQSIYGGKIDNEFDNRVLQSLVERFFRAESFNINFGLFDVPKGCEIPVLTIPEGRDFKTFMDWINNLPAIESPLWSGLPGNVEKILREQQTLKLISNFKSIQGTDEDIGDQQSEKKGSGAGWLTALGSKVKKLREALPSQIEALQRTGTSITHPFFRFLEREITVASSLLDEVKEDLRQLYELCTGERRSTNVLRTLAQALHSDTIPTKWRKYAVGNISATDWLIDFKNRLD